MEKRRVINHRLLVVGKYLKDYDEVYLEVVVFKDKPILIISPDPETLIEFLKTIGKGE